MAKPVTQTAPDLNPDQEKLLEWTRKGFDLRTRILDPKTGKLIRHQPYSLVVNKDSGNYYIRDGKRFDLNGRLLSPAEAKGK